MLLVLNTTEMLTGRALVQGGRPSRRQGVPAGTPAHSARSRRLTLRPQGACPHPQRDGWEVSQARDGVNALEVLQNYRPSVVLMDIEMPRMDGFELASILKEIEDYGRPPVVMITSRAARSIASGRKRSASRVTSSSLTRRRSSWRCCGKWRRSVQVGSLRE